ncbi:hypothetical protein LSTR_LSTR004527 [Laodelphax striatellus]|uniref:Vacuolar protein sorting-associated protein 13 VPS13 adaptor binding domain-containing protein n=1 Tax=Laodelphax striatellus TaxID=195883 RepID=A0A482WTA9_LAOST|nr:hypothetical protein LSTR_LSTR004527 [Laodelphax striatellus]
MSLALCVHLDTTAISIAISEEQVALLANLAVILAEVYQTLMPNWSVEPKHKEDAIFSTDPVVGSEDSPSNSLPEEDQTGGSPSGPVKLTGSLQWTLARLTVSVYNNHQTKISPEKLKLTLDVEDIFISLDIEKVYHKLKLKIATASVQHYLRPTSKNSWEVGPFEGLVMRGHDPDGLGISTAPTNEENTPNSSGFLTATLTRAYCSNLHSKLATSAKTSKVLKKAVVEDRFITEIEVKLQPLDFVLSPTTLGTILNVLNPIVQLSRKKTAASASSPALRPATLTYFTSSSLPLLYLDLMAVRIVLCVSEKMHCHHDVVLIQFDSVSTNPQPENPLCRVPVRPDIYQAAEKHRILSVPGSEIEDRQYQLDVVGLSVSTGSWKEIRSMLVKDTVPILQNPALDWNEGRRPSSIPSALENLCSLIPSFNVCLVLAPAIIYQGNTIVCGHSTEVNAVSEITVALSVEQVELFGVLVRELIQILPKKGKDSVSTEPRLWFPDRYLPIKESLPYVSVHRDSIDSGVRTVPSGSNQTVVKDIVSFKGSMDLNTVSFTKGLSSISPSQSIPPTNSAFSLNKRFVGVKENSVPLEILITGSGLSSSIYSLVNGSKSSEIHPLLHMRISQPHAFLSKHGDTLNVQASIFDMSAKSGLTENRNSTTITRDKLSPKVFQQILIETRNGEPHVLTGIPPALLSVKWNRISTKPAKLDIDIGRPVRFMISLDSVNYVRDVVKKLACKWNPIHPAPEDELCDADANDDMDSGIKEESHTGYKTNYRKKYCSYLNVISVSTQKMIAAFLTENPDDGNVSLSVDGISLTTNLSQHSFSNAFAFRAVTVATQTEGKTKLLINPWSLSINVSLFWESWLQSPTLQIRANSDFLNINIAPDTLQCLKQVYSEYYNYYLKETSSNSVSQQTTSNYVIDQELEQEQHYKEDLQAGAFQFVDGGDDRDELPLTYQVVFWTGCHQNPTMAWRYPQPRALTRLFIQPLPFRDSQPGDKVDCCLQYWSECEGAFKDYISFSLCESVACTVALPAADPLPAVASIWRVLLGSPSQCHQLPINVKALAACLRVDSYFCLSLIPRLQAAISLSSAKVSIWTEVNTMRPMPAQFSRYTCDGLIPSSHNVMIFSLCQTSTSYCKWKQGHLLITCDGKPRVDILNYRTLCMLCCVEPFRFTSRLSLSCGTSQSVNIVTEGVTCRIGPAICHTLSVTAQLWNQYSTSVPQHLIIMTPFVICNNSHLPIRFGQAETKEVISLQCMQCHLYSWFSTKSNLAIRFSLAQTNGCETWSKPVSLRETESQLISVCDEESRDWNLVITTRPISSFVTEVMISGQLIIQNTMDCDVELMVSCERQNSMVVPAKNTPPGIILSPHYAPFLRIRFPGISFTWSGQIPLKNDSENTLKQWLVKVPLRNKEEFNSIWCHLVWDSPNTSGRIFVMICSMYRISSLLPCGAYAHIETPELDSMKSAVIVGNGQVQDLVCPGTPENSHFLTFQLEGKTQPSSSKVPVSYSVIEPRLSAQNTKVINMNELIEKALSNEEPTNYPISGCTSAQWTSAGQQETVVLVKVDYSLDFVEPRSLQVEVSPWALLINSLGCHVCLQANNQIICSLPHLSVIAPPTIESTFHLGLYIGTAMYLSHPLQLARDLSFYMPHISGIIPLEGCINTTVDCGSIVSYVNIASIDMKGTRLLHVRASYVIANFSPWALKIVPLVVRRNQDDKGKQFCLPRNLDLHTITLQPQNPRAKQNKGHPLTEWLSVGVGDPEASFLSVSLGGDFSCPVAVPQTQERDSVPVLVPLSTPVQHINSSLLLCSEVKDGQTFITLWNQDWPQIIVHNHTTLTLALAKAKTDKGGAAEDYNPDWPWQLRLPPGCSADYHLPSCNEQLIQNGSKPSPMVVIAVVESSTDLVWSEAISLSPCRGRLLRLSGTSGFNVAVNNRGFTTHIVLSHMNHTEISPLDVRLRLMQESQINNDADSQRGNEEQSFKPIPRPLEMPAITNFEEPSLDKHAIESGNVKCISCPDKSCLPGLEDVTCFLQNITVIVGMESSSACDCREVAALIMDDIGFTIQPTKNPESEAKELLIRVTLGDIQFDNQEYSSGGYDFPVVLMIQPQEPSEPQHVEFSINGSALTLVEMSRTKGSALDLIMTVDVNSYRTPALQDASLTLKPFQIYVEDTYLIELKKILAKIVPTNSFCDVPSSVNKEPQHPDTPKTVAKSVASSTVTTEDHLTVSEAHGSSITTKQNAGAEDEERDEELFNVSEPEQDVPSFGLLPEKITTMYDILPFDNESSVVEVASNKSLDIENSRLGSEIYVDKDEAEEYLCNLIIPKEIIAAAQELAFPLRLRSLTISPLSVLVSLHTSTAFYIAIDHSPLNFSSFKRGSLVSTAYRLGHALTLHYFLGAFYGSAWALVSLELLGAPGGLARTVGSGMRDFVSLPYQGIQQGPRAFLLGIAHGSASLMKHVTAGTITSVTKLAASWARTLDRLTLDRNDLVLSEESRRHRPEGLTQGLMHGLSEFGIRLLGAVGSIVHQPLQYAISPNPDQSLANSIGLGVVGVFARPLSGAAELVARTGEGILSGAGWSSLPKSRNQSRSPHSHCSVEAVLKFSWKLLAPSEQIFFALEASSAENYESIVLLITRNHLHIIRMENGPVPFKSILLSELRISSHHSDPTLIVLTVVSPEVEAEELSRTRVAQFVRDCSRVVSEDTNVQLTNIPDSSHSFASEPSYSYFVNPEIREYFMTFINFVKRNSTNRDFSVIS